MRDAEIFSQKIVTMANNLPKDQNLFWEKFAELRKLLSEVRSTGALNNWNLPGLENWLRYQVVQVFRSILGNDLNPHLFKIAFAKVSSDDDEDGIRNALCADYMYRQALPILQAQARKQNTGISTDMLFDRRNGVDLRIVNDVIAPLMNSNNEGMPYVKQKNIHFMMDPVQNFGETRQAYDERIERARNKVHQPIIWMLKDRIEQFGILDPLPPYPFHVVAPEREPLLPKQSLSKRKNHSVLDSLVGGFRAMGKAVARLLRCFCTRSKPHNEIPMTEIPAKQSRSNESLHRFYKATNSSDNLSLSAPCTEVAFPYDVSSGHEALYIPTDSVDCLNIKRYKK